MPDNWDFGAFFNIITSGCHEKEREKLGSRKYLSLPDCGDKAGGE